MNDTTQHRSQPCACCTLELSAPISQLARGVDIMRPAEVYDTVVLDGFPAVRDLTRGFRHSNLEPIDAAALQVRKLVAKPRENVPRQLLGRRMNDRQEERVSFGKREPRAVLVNRRHVFSGVRNGEAVALSRQQNLLVELITNSLGRLFHQREVEHIAVFADLRRHAHRDLVVVTVKSLAKSLVGDKVRSRELEVILEDVDLKGTVHRAEDLSHS